MKIENDKIIQATEDELYSYWLSRGWDDIYPFPEYMQRMKDAGCEIVVETLPTLFERITESPEVLAPNFVYRIDYGEAGGGYVSTIVNGLWHTEAEAINATAAKLKEV